MNAYPLALSIVMAYERAGETSAARIQLVAAIAEILALALSGAALAEKVRALLPALQADRARLEGAIRLARAAAEAERVRLVHDFCVTGLDGCPVLHSMDPAEAHIVGEWRELRDALDRALARAGAGR